MCGQVNEMSDDHEVIEFVENVMGAWLVGPGVCGLCVCLSLPPSPFPSLSLSLALLLSRARAHTRQGSELLGTLPSEQWCAHHHPLTVNNGKPYKDECQLLD